MQKLVLVLALLATFWGVAGAYTAFLRLVQPPVDPWQRTVNSLKAQYSRVEKRLTLELTSRIALLKYWRKED